MNFHVQPYDPIDEALEQLVQFNATPTDEREHTEEELIGLLAHRVQRKK